MAIEASSVRELRDRTSAGFLDCKNALEEANGDFEKAGEILRKKGLAKAMKKGSRGTPEGRVGSYIHTNGKLGVLVEINCETDFVAKNDVFADLIKDICMHIAATDPMAVSRETVPQEMIDREKKAYNEEFKDKPDNVRDKIIDGKMESFYKEVCLINQPFVKD
ncbi:MAG: translation elongation factor Ts, partial [Deltaproteobacteria bacterium]|nr:translation elongation factor Ts [Deltaproteobacteria bacterium]